jgi:Tol biopolymer transport system component
VTPERLREIERLFHEARERTPAERDGFLARACADDPTLRREVESLLAQPPAGLIDAPIGALVVGLVSPASVLLTGRRIGVFEVQGLLGVGGMGEVYRARDSRLGREVAIKILPRAFKDDPDRLARFEREARVLASLNHPHIGAIYGLEDADDVTALVMELVDGEDLSERVARGALPLDEALPIARQIAEALEAAHEQGIIHRDLKPANIKVRSDGTVKVLDFGLAKALDPTGVSSPSVTTSPTLSLATQAGMILGTAAYMAPEQARGRVVDTRADIWAFGCVLYEMVTGARAFKSDDVTDTIVAVVSKEPDWQKLPATARSVRPMLARCLKKDPKQRLQAIGDARILVDELIGGTSEDVAARATAATRPRRVVATAIAGLAGAAVIGAMAMWAMTRPRPQGRVLPSRFEIVPPLAQALAIQGADRDIAISPDGQYIVYRADAGRAQLVVRPIDRLDARPVAGITNARQPFFSPDSEWIGFFDGAGLKKAPIAGGSATMILKNYVVPRGASWGDDNSIVFATNDSSTGLLRVPASGGEPTVLTRPDAAKGEKNHWRPSLLPDGRGILFTITALNAAVPPQVAVLDMKTGQRKILIRGGSQAEYVSTGHLLYAAANTLHAVRFDLGRLEVLSDPVPVVDDVSMLPTAAANYAVSRVGTLVYVPASGTQRPRSLVWVDRTGQETPTGAPPRLYAQARLSPDGKRVALSIRDQEHNIWIWDLGRETPLTRLTFDPGDDDSPVWTPDGRRIVFASMRAGAPNLFMQAADGTGIAERLTTGPDSQAPAWVAPEGMGIVGTVIAPKTNGDIVWFPLKGSASRSGSGPVSGARLSEAEPLVRTTAIETNPDISPDGRYIAYGSNESGREEIYVRPFPHVNDGRWQVSTSGGTRPAWSRNGQELFYVDLANTLTAVPVQTSGARFATGNPAKLFEMPSTASLTSDRDYDVSPDGKRFLMIKENVARDGNATAGMVVVQNWFEVLKAKVPPGK